MEHVFVLAFLVGCASSGAASVMIARLLMKGCSEERAAEGPLSNARTVEEESFSLSVFASFVGCVTHASSAMPSKLSGEGRSEELATVGPLFEALAVVFPRLLFLVVKRRLILLRSFRSGVTATGSVVKYSSFIC